MSSLTTQDGVSPVAANAARSSVLIVDDHPLYRNGLRELFRNELNVDVAGEAETEEDAYEQVVRLKPDLVTVDVSLASGNGLNLIARIKKDSPKTAVLVISMFEDRVYSDLALAAGASGYICKQSTGAELKQALQTVRNGEIYVSPNVLQNMLGAKHSSREAAKSLHERRLSSRELQIFTMIGQGRNTHEIATELGIAVSTVETYRERLKTKLNLSSGSELTRHALFWMMQNS
jgi:DNA-binding NarL/FixJ family response regulator